MILTRKTIISLIAFVLVSTTIGTTLVITLNNNTEFQTNLLNSPEIVHHNGYDLILETFLWRDFMPGSNSEGSDLMAIIFIIAENAMEFPQSIDAVRMWIFNGEDVWETDLEDLPEDYPKNNNELVKRADGGPKWETKISVDVVIKLRTIQGENYFIKAINQYIEETW